MLSNNYCNILNITRLFVINHMKSYDLSHDFNHIDRVVKLSKIIFNKENINNYNYNNNYSDAFQIEMSALLHDIGDNKYIDNNTCQTNIIKNYLDSINSIDPNDKNEILRISTNISLSKDKDDLSNSDFKLNIVRDADRIDSLGSIGIMRYISYNLIKINNHNFDSIVNNIDERTQRLIKMIRTDTGKKIANKQVKIIKDFVYNYRSNKL